MLILSNYPDQSTNFEIFFLEEWQILLQLSLLIISESLIECLRNYLGEINKCISYIHMLQTFFGLIPIVIRIT
jgi:hypothetical protein